MIWVQVELAKEWPLIYTQRRSKFGAWIETIPGACVFLLLGNCLKYSMNVMFDQSSLRLLFFSAR